uniref:Uncharacterized protein n=1 Tax=Oryza sativa subsp. japonica TaxID=39947 RepID=Q8GVQ4_ORYSJ|nr:hypothetical protein [Oryza sativa Japonica Group]
MGTEELVGASGGDAEAGADEQRRPVAEARRAATGPGGDEARTSNGGQSRTRRRPVAEANADERRSGAEREAVGADDERRRSVAEAVADEMTAGRGGGGRRG